LHAAKGKTAIGYSSIIPSTEIFSTAHGMVFKKDGVMALEKFFQTGPV
jgi:hypothetical protein